jgi:hypothetical protein
MADLSEMTPGNSKRTDYVVPLHHWRCNPEIGSAKRRLEGAMMDVNRNWKVVCLFAVLGATLVGCSNNDTPLYPVSGKVTYPDGTPLSGGWVSFRPTDGETKVSARGQVRSDGTFELTTYANGDGAVIGRNQVLVMPPMYGDREDPKTSRPPSFSRRFSNFATSGLEFVVTDDSSKNRFEIVVSKDAAK